MTLLEVSDLVVRHGQLTAVEGVRLSVDAGAAVAVVGANGAGKSTLLRTISGLHHPAAGRIRYDGQDVTSVSTHERVRRGLVMVPEGRRLFPSMTVEENLLVGAAVGRSGDWSLDRVYELFPWMTERRGQATGLLSGGEQQGVAIGRALMTNPRVLLLDEISLGLAPVAVQRIYSQLPDLLAAGMTALIVEQDVRQALRYASHVVCLLEGRMTLEGPPAAFTPEQIEAAYFGFMGADEAGATA
ncbi:MAG TPA: ABC transporter ATP-binding protein [Mycobacteriales bacterium]|jgi:branched-chain amino acid transport system ATP-binding protein|nr:ABC transporter ATP-binding protein [Mycobacteriales bacterium]